MKGIIFLRLEEFIEELYGEAAWDEILLTCSPESEGAYTANLFYEDSEFFALFNTICDIHKLEAEKAQFLFGQWCFTRLLSISPHDLTPYTDTFGFLRAINDVIHIEVMKLHPDAILPEFKFLEQTQDRLLMEYVSPRGLCFFCHGLIDSLANHVKETVSISQSKCKHQGDDACLFEIVK